MYALPYCKLNIMCTSLELQPTQAAVAMTVISVCVGVIAIVLQII